MKHITIIHIVLLAIAIMWTDYDIIQLKKTVFNNNRIIVESINHNMASLDELYELEGLLANRFKYFSLQDKCNGNLILNDKAKDAISKGYKVEGTYTYIYSIDRPFESYKSTNPKDYNCLISETKTVPLIDLIK